MSVIDVIKFSAGGLGDEVGVVRCNLCAFFGFYFFWMEESDAAKPQTTCYSDVNCARYIKKLLREAHTPREAIPPK